MIAHYVRDGAGQSPAFGLYTEDVPLFPEPDEGEPAEIIYTSGTTGRLKGAMLSHQNLYSNARVFGEELKISPDERTLIVAPMFHIAAQTCCLNATLVMGGTCYLLERWTTAEATLETINRHKITFFLRPPYYVCLHAGIT